MYQIELIFSSYCKQQISTQKNFAFIWGIDFIGAFSIQGQYVRKKIDIIINRFNIIIWMECCAVEHFLKHDPFILSFDCGSSGICKRGILSFRGSLAKSNGFEVLQHCNV